MVSSNGSEDMPSDLDISVVRTAIDMGHRMIEQIVNGVHYGSDEVRGLLYDEIDYILECKVCRNLFRSFPNLVAHKRIYCQEMFEEKLEREKAVPVRIDEETVIVEPQSPEEGSEAASVGKDAGKGLIDDVVSNKFDGKSVEYQFYTKIAENLELRKSARVTNSVMMTAIPSNPHAVVVSHAKGDHTSRSMPNRSPTKSDLNKDRTVSLANICMKLASTDRVEVVKPQAPTQDTKSGQFKRSRKSQPKKSTKEYVGFFPETLMKKKEPGQDSKGAVKPANTELMKHCDITTMTCKTCGFHSASLSGLKNHISFLHGLRVGDKKCPRCSKYYSTVKNVCRHLRTAHGYSETQITNYKRWMIKMKAASAAQNKSTIRVQPITETNQSSVATETKQVVVSSGSQQGAEAKQSGSGPAKPPVAMETKELAKNGGLGKGVPANVLKRLGDVNLDWLKKVDLVQKKCKVCLLYFGTMSGLKLHMSKQHGYKVGKFKCIKCNNFFAACSTLRRHLQLHDLSEAQRKECIRLARKNYATMPKQSPDGKMRVSAPARPEAPTRTNAPTSADRKATLLYAALTTQDEQSKVASIKKEDKGLNVSRDSSVESVKIAKKTGKETVTKETVKSLTKEASKSPMKESTKIDTKAQAKSVTRDQGKPTPKEPGKDTTKEPPRSPTKVMTKDGAKSITREQVKAVKKDMAKSSAKDSGKPSQTETPKSSTKESTKNVTKESVKSCTKEQVKSVSKEPGKSVTKEVARTVTKLREPAKVATREAGTSTSSSRNHSAKSPAATISGSARREPGIAGKIPKLELQNGGTPSSGRKEIISSERPMPRLQKESSSASDSKIVRRERKLGQMTSTGSMSALLSRTMKQRRASLTTARRLQLQTAVKEQMEEGRLQREMKKLENSAGFVESNIYSSSGSGRTGRKRLAFDEAE